MRMHMHMHMHTYTHEYTGGLGRALKSMGHRVRLATHAVHRDIVKQAGVEHFSIGGDPKQLSQVSK